MMSNNVLPVDNSSSVSGHSLAPALLQAHFLDHNPGAFTDPRVAGIAGAWSAAKKTAGWIDAEQ
jgi:hypothetical protein